MTVKDTVVNFNRMLDANTKGYDKVKGQRLK